MKLPRARRSLLLSSLLVFCIAGETQAEPQCSIEQGLQQVNDPDASESSLRRMLARCDAARAADAAASDFRLPLLHGLVERRSANLRKAATWMERAHAEAPSVDITASELALSYEQLGRFPEAAALYDRVLRTNPQSIPGHLGAARIARAQMRLDTARRHYAIVAKTSPSLLDTRTGTAFVDLDNKDFSRAEAGFREVLASDPNNKDALAGLRQLEKAYRYALELAVGRRDLAAGSANSGTANFSVAVNATDTVEAGIGRNSRELATLRPFDPAPLPRKTARLGYRHAGGVALGWAMEYEYLERRSSGDEHRVAFNLNGPLSGNARWFAGSRKDFGGVPRASLIHAGTTVPIGHGFEATGTLYHAREKRAGSSSAMSAQVGYHTANRAYYSVGVSRNPERNISSTFARLHYPVARMQELVVAVERRSRGGETEALVGWRFYWK